MEPSAGRILMVDDEPNVLSGYRRSLHNRFDIVTAASGQEGLAELRSAADNPFQVVVSDMMMPEMNGATFLAKVRELQPSVVQLLLSGQADLESTISAVNDADLFRFLTKPCSSADLETALNAALRQYQLVGSERELLERTLSGTVDVLTQVLSLASKDVAARTERVRALVGAISETLDVNDWRLPLAAMLSQIGCIAVPPAVLKKAQEGLVAGTERDVFLAHPQAGRQLLERIPRLEDVARWVGEQSTAVRGMPWLTPVREPGSPAEQVFHLVHDFLAAYDLNHDQDRAMALLPPGSPPEQLAALRAAAHQVARRGAVREITVAEAQPGMVLAEDVRTPTGVVVFSGGERLTDSMTKRLNNYARTIGVVKPIRVIDAS